MVKVRVCSIPHQLFKWADRNGVVLYWFHRLLPPQTIHDQARLTGNWLGLTDTISTALQKVSVTKSELPSAPLGAWTCCLGRSRKPENQEGEAVMGRHHSVRKLFCLYRLTIRVNCLQRHHMPSPCTTGAVCHYSQALSTYQHCPVQVVYSCHGCKVKEMG